MKELYNNVYWVSASAEAYYSGNSVTNGIFVSKELWDNIDGDILSSVWYHELDGKHSEVEASVTAQLLDEDNIYSVLMDYEQSDGEDWYITESYLDGQDEGLIEQIEAFHEDFIEKITFCKTVVIKFNGKEISVSR